VVTDETADLFSLIHNLHNSVVSEIEQGADMTIYLYKCKECGEIFEIEWNPEWEKPTEVIKEHGNGCIGVAHRKFTIPGMFVPYADEDWVVRIPGEVGRERRDMKWRRKHGKANEEV